MYVYICLSPFGLSSFINLCRLGKSQDDFPKVSFLDLGGPVSATGKVVVGDYVISVNGIPMLNVTSVDAIHILKSAGSDPQIVFRRDPNAAVQSHLVAASMGVYKSQPSIAVPSSEQDETADAIGNIPGVHPQQDDAVYGTSGLSLDTTNTVDDSEKAGQSQRRFKLFGKKHGNHGKGVNSSKEASSTEISTGKQYGLSRLQAIAGEHSLDEMNISSDKSSTVNISPRQSRRGLFRRKQK